MSRTRLAAAAALSVAGWLCLPAAAPAAAPTAGPAAPAAAPAPAAPAGPAPAGPGTGAAGAEGGRLADLTATVSRDGRALRIRIAPLVDVPAGAVEVTVSAGEKVTGSRQQPVTGLRADRPVEVEVPLPDLPAGDGGVSVGLVVAGSRAGGDFVAVRRDRAGNLVSAGTLAQLPEAVLDADLRSGRITAASHRAAVAQLHLAPGYDVEDTTVSPPANRAAAATTRVSGQATYTYPGAGTRYLREASVALVSSTGSTYARSKTDAYGVFSLTTTTLPGPTSLAVQVTTENPAGVVRTRSGVLYSAMSGYRSLSPGQSWDTVAVALTTASETTNAFALLDALRSAGGYYQRIRATGWDPGIVVTYPSATNTSFTSRTTHVIQISGGETRCGEYWCPEDAYDWDVLAHETGHVVAYQAGIDASPGGEHFVCDNAWGTRTKLDGVRLAWSEGWATFYGLAALAQQGTPNIPGAGDARYSDKVGPPHNDAARVDGFDYSLETVDYCSTTPRGEDSEMAVSRVLWDLYDAAGDNGESVAWTLPDILGRLSSAHAVTFTAAYAALTANRPIGEVDSAQAALEAYGMSPTGISPATTVTGTCPPKITWSAGGPAMHPNRTFFVRATVLDGRAVAFQQDVGTATSYTPTLAQWQAATRTGALTLEVAGVEGTVPESGPFWSRPRTLTATAAPALMVAGDSISHGLEEDYTWRYRLAQHLSGGCGVDFVGPWSGTTVLPAAQPDDFPAHTAPPSFSGRYRGGLTFDSQHWARWGRQLAEAKNEVRSTVATYRPTHLLVELGFNDLGWSVSDPDGLIASMRTFVTEARAARPDVRILVANVVHRTPLDINPGLSTAIDAYNQKLGPALQALSTATSPVVLVDISGPYDPWADTYDGLHPDGRGEYKIAKAFADVLASRFGIGTPFAAIPASVPDVVPPRPASITATATPAGITVRWAHSAGASGYWLYQRDVTLGQAFGRSALQIPADSWKVNWLFRGHTYEFKVVAARGDDTLSAESPVASAVADPRTADGPTGVTAHPATSSIQLSWTRPTTPYSDTVSGYKIFYLDETAVGELAKTVTTTATSYTLTGLVNEHRYSVAVASINAAGDGLPSGAPASIVGYGAPAATTLTSAYLVNDGTVDLTWQAVQGAAGYWIDQRFIPTGEPLHRLPVEVYGRTTERITYLVSGAQNYEHCVVSANGSYLAPRSNCRIATWPPGSRAEVPAAAPTRAGRAPGAGPLPVDPLLWQRGPWTALARHRPEGVLPR